MTCKAEILVVDDNISQNKTLSIILRHSGHNVTSAENGLEAVNLVQGRPFDLIMMDIKMPVMNGAEACQQIRQIRPSAMVVMMTAYAVEDLVQQALDAGAYEIIYKPLDIKRALAIVDQVRQKRADNVQTPTAEDQDPVSGCGAAKGGKQ
jgi:CheY-like chemotaxis protein